MGSGEHAAIYPILWFIRIVLVDMSCLFLQFANSPLMPVCIESFYSSAKEVIDESKSRVLFFVLEG